MNPQADIKAVLDIEPPAVRAAAREILTIAAAGRGLVAKPRLRPGFLTGVRLYVAAIHHPAASDRLRGSLFEAALDRVVYVRRAA